MKKLLLFVAILFISFSWVSYAVSKFNYESALQIANEYIANSSFDENWKDHNPIIVEKWKEFHTDDDNKTSYVEFKVSCDNNPNCWFVMVNFDWDDVTVPIASTSWNTPSEVLVAQNWGNKDDNKLYYFSPFEQYSENEKSWEISSIDPVDNIDSELSKDTKLTKEQKQEKRKEHRNELKNRVIKAKNEASDFKKSDDFKNKIKDLRDKKQSIPKEEFSYKILPFGDYANADEPVNWWTNWYVAPAASNKFIPWVSSVWNCYWPTPCYQQFDTTYWWVSCKSWCSPTAIWIIYWYYDRQLTYPDLIPWTANYINDYNSTTMIKAVWVKMNTYCTWWQWATSSSYYTKWIEYAIDKGYTKSTATKYTWTVSSLFTTIKTEINAWRPIMVNNATHSMAAYGYNSTTWSPIIRVNMWWWPTSEIRWTNLIYYKTSSIDYNMNSLYYNWANKTPISNIVKIYISK